MATHLTHRRDSNQAPGHQMLFVEHEAGDEGARNAHYGEWVFVLKTALPEVPELVAEMAAEHWDIDLDEAREFVAPADIVDAGEAWDSIEFCGIVYERTYAVGYATPDGAVVLSPTEVELEIMHEDEYYERYGR